MALSSVYQLTNLIGIYGPIHRISAGLRAPGAGSVTACDADSTKPECPPPTKDGC